MQVENLGPANIGQQVKVTTKTATITGVLRSVSYGYTEDNQMWMTEPNPILTSVELTVGPWSATVTPETKCELVDDGN